MKKTKIFIMWGIALCVLVLLGEFILLNTCIDNITCILTNTVLVLPGVIGVDILGIGVNPTLNIVINALFYFLLGGIIGLLIHLIRKPKTK